MSARRSSALKWLLPALGAGTLLLFNTGWRWAATGLDEIPGSRRYWEDVTVAASRVGKQPEAEPEHIGSGEGQDRRHGLQRNVLRQAGGARLSAWTFWRTVHVKPWLRRGELEARPSDDPGRGYLLTAAYTLLGGVAPALPLWLGAFVALPVLLWAAFDLARAGFAVAAAAFVLLFAASPYAVDMLSLPYSAVGFYLLALVGLAPLAAYAALAEPVTARGLLGRGLAAGLLLAVCSLCRGGTLLQLPGFALAVVLGSARLRGASRARRALVGALGVALLPLPFAAVRPAQHHETWLGIWEGLGDFDRSHGHAWSDKVVKSLLAEEGVVLAPDAPVWQDAVENEAIFRRRVLESIRSEPSWYAGILVKRLGATLVQWKLWPWGPREGLSLRPASSPQEGATDVYYGMTAGADRVGVGAVQLELPISLLLAPAVVLALLWARGAARVPARAGLAMACVAVAALALPVAVTTASGPETQCFVVVYWLGAAFLLQESVSWLRARRATA